MSLIRKRPGAGCLPSQPIVNRRSNFNFDPLELRVLRVALVLLGDGPFAAVASVHKNWEKTASSQRLDVNGGQNLRFAEKPIISFRNNVRKATCPTVGCSPSDVQPVFDAIVAIAAVGRL